jgi:predicted glycoside hydrolase/deacetylase ChbG (UPF0249 family)
MTQSAFNRGFFAITMVGASLLLAAPGATPESNAVGSPRELAIRCDDVGMCHTVNLAVQELLETGVPFSVSVMVPCPWFLEAVEILNANPQIGVGIHLTLNSEWEHYKWGPVLGAATVPSLVDEHGYFFASETEFAAAEVDLDEVEMELRAQIDRALKAGLRVDYLDYHMLTAVSTPELRAIVEGLAEEYGLGLSRYFGETSVSIWADPPEEKLTSLLGHVRNVRPGLSLLVIHLGMETPEMSALVDMNNESDPFRTAIHRQAELEAITSPAFRMAIEGAGIELVTYREIIDTRGLDTMTAPADLSSYASSLVEEP